MERNVTSCLMPVAVVPHQGPTMAHGSPLCTVLVARVLPLLALATLRNGLGLRPARRERERAGQQQFHRILGVDVNVLPFMVVAGSRPLTSALTRFVTNLGLLRPGDWFSRELYGN